MRILLPALLLAGVAISLLGAPAHADAQAPTGTWTWTYPNADLPVGPGHVVATTMREQGTLALGGGSGSWTVELPSAIVGCAEGKPQYAPKAGQTAILQTYPDGSCILYFVNNGHYEPHWRSGTSAAGATLGPFWGAGDFQ